MEQVQNKAGNSFFTEEERMQLYQRCILKVAEEHHKRTHEGIDEETLCAGTQLLVDIKLNQGLLNLIYAGKIRARMNEEADDIEFISVSPESTRRGQ